MGAVTGIEILQAFKKAAAWGTAVACGANDGFLGLPDTLSRDAGVDVDDSQGVGVSTDGTPGPIKVAGDLPGYLRFDFVDLFVAMVMGTAGVPTQQGATAAYLHTLAWAVATDGLFGTFARNMQNYIAEAASLKITGFTLEGDRGEKPIRLTAHTTGSDLVFNTTGGVNNNTTFANVTIMETANRARMSDGVFLLNNQGGAALSDPTDKILPSKFKLSVMRKMEGVYTGGYLTSGSNKQDLIDEPIQVGSPEVRLNLEFPRHTGVTNLLALGSDARKKIQVTFTGALIEAAYYRQIKIMMPHLQYAKVPVTNAQGAIVEPVEFICHGADAAPAGMTGITKPLQIEWINKRSTNPLA